MGTTLMTFEQQIEGDSDAVHSRYVEVGEVGRG